MRLRKLFYKNNTTGWNVNEVRFDRLTLLVGASGVGKTQILRAINSLKTIANGHSVNGAEWEVEFVENGASYSWSGCFDKLKPKIEDIYHFTETDCAVLRETLLVDNRIVIERNNSVITYEGNPTVKLDANKSVVDLLKEEENVAPVANAFQKIYYFLDSDESGLKISPSVDVAQKAKLNVKQVKKQKGLSPFEKLFLLKINGLEEYQCILDDFKSIFPLVEDIDFAIGAFFNDLTIPILKIKEKDVDSWIFQQDVSSGMLRTLSQIVMLTLADSGDVFLIDEFENGLGVNCINQLADLVMNPSEDIQVIMTSHHPYIINTIPFECWKIVTRSGCDVTVHSADELNIGIRSKHEAFMQLLQSNAYKTGRL